jgi:hypothetical protein
MEQELMGMPVDLNLGAACGSYCGECRYYKQGCDGCGYVKGKTFWGECRFYSCTREKGVEHCGLCGDFPCSNYLSTYAPAEGK